MEGPHRRVAGAASAALKLDRRRDPTADKAGMAPLKAAGGAQ